MHTPGPWIIEPPEEHDPPGRPVVVGGGRGLMPVAEILGPLADEDGPHRGHYDTRLICAAPGLLRACEAALALLSQTHFGDSDRTLEATLDLAGGPWVGRLLREAIANAKGE